MPKTLISILFTLIFAFLLAAPTVISWLDEDIDVTAFYSMAEEENSKETLKLYEFEVKDNPSTSDLLYASEKHKVGDYYLNLFTQFYLENTSPPPEQHII